MSTTFLLFPVRLLALAALGAAWLLPAPARAQDSGDVHQAFEVARAAVAPDLQNRVVSVYGLGTPDAIHKWFIIFYDPSVASHGRAVLVENEQVKKTYNAQVSTHYSSKLTFDPARITSEQPALNAAQDYATKHNITYTGVRALLKQISLNKPFRWRIELLDGATSRGFVMVNAVDDTVAAYVPPSRADGGSGSVSEDAQGFGRDVKNTFLGIGGDLEQFFTGERTVDR